MGLSVIRDLKEYHVKHMKTDFQQVRQFEFLGEVEERSAWNQKRTQLRPRKLNICVKYDVLLLF